MNVKVQAGDSGVPEGLLEQILSIYDNPVVCYLLSMRTLARPRAIISTFISKDLPDFNTLLGTSSTCSCWERSYNE